ncbi:CAP domain-containing protein [Salinispora arenicola]|uniref:Uncharacterized protein YkwD n=1 Tax=Salinispora arenicola TaxID=168697 RepID=A0A542XLI7_SALAC|nr:CAP domain-containing protein [Salinispora arenicola]TQL36640.1 uncharacterized protein YkwD [Salinispora arenicola]GIM87606.1 hypothetical protein Sar04_43420 [Salinispora arenicola]
MYGWSESMEPDDSRRRSEPAADAWDRPADGWDRPTDGWDRPADGWYRQRNAHWRAESETPQGWGTAGGSYHDHPSRSGESVPTGQQRGSTDGWQQELSGGWRRRQPTDWRNESSGGWRHAAGATGGPEVTGGWRPDETTARPTSGHADDPTSARPIAGAAPADATPASKGHRVGHRNRRPVLIGAAAAAMLVVSLGASAAALSDGGDTIPTSAHKDITAASPTSYERDVTSSSTSTAWGTGSRSWSDSAHRKSASKASRHSAKSRSDQERKRARHRPKPAHTTTAPSPTQILTTAPSPTQVPTTAPSPTQVPTTAPSNGDVSTEVSEVVRLTNAERAKAGCEALSINEKLMTAAQQHSQDQADHQDMSHTGSNGSNLGDRLKAVGYQFRVAAENVAWNQQSPEAVMNAWMNSPDHRANILNCSYTEIGVGVARSNGPYWTQVFAAPL